MATKQLNEKTNKSTQKEISLKKEVEKWMLNEWGQRCPDNERSCKLCKA